jgi:tripartite-type tricarboxylate transporter receptor subunit TctC
MMRLLPALLLSLACPFAYAAERLSYPERPVRVIVPADAGSATGNLARVLATALTDVLGRQVVVDNRPGASGLIGLELTARAAADGYTLLSTGPGIQVVTPQLQKKLTFDPFRDFLPIALYASASNVLSVHPALPAKSVRDFLALAKASPGTIRFSSAGTGTQGHLAGTQLIMLTGIDVLHVPYKSGGASTTAVIANEAQFSMSPMPNVLPHVLAGRLRALGVGGSERSPKLPDVPTIAEAGVPGYHSTGWAGLLSPRGVPPAIVKRLNAAVVDAMSRPEARERIERLGAEVRVTTSSDFAALIRSDWDSYGKAIKAANIKIE